MKHNIVELAEMAILPETTRWLGQRWGFKSIFLRYVWNSVTNVDQSSTATFLDRQNFVV